MQLNQHHCVEGAASNKKSFGYPLHFQPSTSSAHPHSAAAQLRCLVEQHASLEKICSREAVAVRGYQEACTGPFLLAPQGGCEAAGRVLAKVNVRTWIDGIWAWHPFV